MIQNIFFKFLESEKDNKNNNFEIKRRSFNDKSDNEGKKMKLAQFSDDNLPKKCRHLLLNHLMVFINKKYT
jgi:hypothetical protein